MLKFFCSCPELTIYPIGSCIPTKYSMSAESWSIANPPLSAKSYRATNRRPIDSEVAGLHALLEWETELLESMNTRRRAAHLEAKTLEKRAQVLQESLLALQALEAQYGLLLASFRVFRSASDQNIETQRKLNEEISPWMSGSSAYIDACQATLEEVGGVEEKFLVQHEATRRRVEDTREQLVAVESLEHHTLRAIEKLDGALAAIRASVEEKRCGALAVSRRIPTEMLEKIFEEAVMAEVAEIHASLPSGHRPFTMALRISGVCQLWRQVMYSLPTLWTYTNGVRMARPAAPPFSLVRRGEEALKHHLVQSSGKPLDLIVRSPGPPLGFSPMSPWNPRGSIAETIPTQCIRFIEVRQIDLPAIRDALRGSDPTFLYFGATTWTGALNPAHFLNTASKLVMNNYIPAFSQTYSSLLHLEIWSLPDNQPFHDIFQLLASLPNLTHLTVHRIRVRRSTLEPIPPYQAPVVSLRTIMIDDQDLIHLESRFGNHPIFPNITHVGIRRSVGESALPLGNDPFSAMFYTARVPLPSQIQSLSNFISSTPTLQTIEALEGAQELVIEALTRVAATHDGFAFTQAQEAGGEGSGCRRGLPRNIEVFGFTKDWGREEDGFTLGDCLKTMSKCC